MGKAIYTFSISRYYRTCTVYMANAKHEVQGRSQISFDKGVGIEERYQLIAKWLREKFRLKCPPYESGRTR